MKIGVTFPQADIGTDPGAIRAFAQAAEDLGFDHITVYDHLLGADPQAKVPGWHHFYDYTDQFHEPMVLFGFLAAVTQRIELSTGIIIVTQRQTVLVAKQAAEVDVLTGGRLRLGIGIGGNKSEHEALGEDFHNRGKRCEEQIEVMRALWTQDVVTFEGRWHTINGGGINPRPVQQPIPLWIGGHADAVLKRTARLADGWNTYLTPDENVEETIASLHRHARDAGRDPTEIGIEARVGLISTPVYKGRSYANPRSPEETARDVDRWRQLGATHVTLNTMDAGLKTADAHIEAIRRFQEALTG